MHRADARVARVRAFGVHPAGLTQARDAQHRVGLVEQLRDRVFEQHVQPRRIQDQPFGLRPPGGTQVLGDGQRQRTTRGVARDDHAVVRQPVVGGLHHRDRRRVVVVRRQRVHRERHRAAEPFHQVGGVAPVVLLDLLDEPAAVQVQPVQTAPRAVVRPERVAREAAHLAPFDVAPCAGAGPSTAAGGGGCEGAARKRCRRTVSDPKTAASPSGSSPAH